MYRTGSFRRSAGKLIYWQHYRGTRYLGWTGRNIRSAAYGMWCRNFTNDGSWSSTCWNSSASFIIGRSIDGALFPHQHLSLDQFNRIEPDPECFPEPNLMTGPIQVQTNSELGVPHYRNENINAEDNEITGKLETENLRRERMTRQSSIPIATSTMLAKNSSR